LEYISFPNPGFFCVEPKADRGENYSNLRAISPYSAPLKCSHKEYQTC
jgi:hypothetical protein